MQVSADLKSTSFVPTPEERRTIQSQTLAALFETYFRVLKHTINSNISRQVCIIFPSFCRKKFGGRVLFDCSVIFRSNFDSTSSGSNDTHPLLAPCLKGLGKFSHLIDLDFMADIMGCLKSLAGLNIVQKSSHGNFLSVSECLQCCIVAFKIMKNNLDALNIDLQEFYNHLYSLLLEYRPGR